MYSDVQVYASTLLHLLRDAGSADQQVLKLALPYAAALSSKGDVGQCWLPTNLASMLRGVPGRR